MAYIASIRVEAQEYGACKIIPPAGWQSRAAGSCAVPDSMRFSPRLMPIHKLMQGVGFQSAADTTVGAYRAKADEFKAALCRRHNIAPDDEAALEALGTKPAEAQKAAQAAQAMLGPQASVEELVRAALKGGG